MIPPGPYMKFGIAFQVKFKKKFILISLYTLDIPHPMKYDDITSVSECERTL